MNVYVAVRLDPKAGVEGPRPFGIVEGAKTDLDNDRPDLDGLVIVTCPTELIEQVRFGSRVRIEGDTLAEVITR